MRRSNPIALLLLLNALGVDGICKHKQLIVREPRGDKHGNCSCCGKATDAVNEPPGGLCVGCGARG